MELIVIPLCFITFLAYGYDKAQAMRNGWRVPERTLLGLSLLGGIGGLLGMQLFRHKTKHQLFWVVNVIGAVFNLFLLGKLGRFW